MTGLSSNVSTFREFSKRGSASSYPKLNLELANDLNGAQRLNGLNVLNDLLLTIAYCLFEIAPILHIFIGESKACAGPTRRLWNVSRRREILIEEGAPQHRLFIQMCHCKTCPNKHARDFSSRPPI